MASHTYILTLLDPCPQTGRPCEVAQTLLETLASAVVQAGDAVGSGISLNGVAETHVCGRTCHLHWTGSSEIIEVSLPAPGRALRAERLPSHLS